MALSLMIDLQLCLCPSANDMFASTRWPGQPFLRNCSLEVVHSAFAELITLRWQCACFDSSKPLTSNRNMFSEVVHCLFGNSLLQPKRNFAAALQPCSTRGTRQLEDEKVCRCGMAAAVNLGAPRVSLRAAFCSAFCGFHAFGLAPSLEMAACRSYYGGRASLWMCSPAIMPAGGHAGRC